jgi:hypothetical protein
MASQDAANLEQQKQILQLKIQLLELQQQCLSGSSSQASPIVEPKKEETAQPTAGLSKLYMPHHYRDAMAKEDSNPTYCEKASEPTTVRAKTKWFHLDQDPLKREREKP